jgi:hypothetical protein
VQSCNPPESVEVREKTYEGTFVIDDRKCTYALMDHSFDSEGQGGTFVNRVKVSSQVSHRGLSTRESRGLRAHNADELAGRVHDHGMRSALRCHESRKDCGRHVCRDAERRAPRRAPHAGVVAKEKREDILGRLIVHRPGALDPTLVHLNEPRASKTLR